jgi:hypothetical protein
LIHEAKEAGWTVPTPSKGQSASVDPYDSTAETPLREAIDVTWFDEEEQTVLVQRTDEYDCSELVGLFEDPDKLSTKETLAVNETPGGAAYLDNPDAWTIEERAPSDPYTNCSLQNLKKEIRECFYFYDKKTKTKIFPTSIDIKNSQLQSLSIKLLEGIEDKLPSTEEFIEKCKEGVIYDYFLEMIINHEPSLWGSGSLSRKDVKKEMLRYLYKNPKQNKRGLLKELDELMESYYPQVYEVITEYKNQHHKGHKNHGGTALAQLLQKDEAEVIKELQMDYPCLTIHDEILLYTPDVNTPKEIEERLKDKGYSQIEVEIGKIEEVKEEDILLLDLSRKSKTNDNKENLVTLNGILLLSIKMGQYFIDFSPPF